MRKHYQKRLSAILGGTLFCCSLGLLLPVFSEATLSYVTGATLLLGGTSAYLFWKLLFNTYPRIAARTKRLLMILYAFGAAAFFTLVGVACYSFASPENGTLHWLAVAFGLAELSEHFAIRWIDGSGWRAYGPKKLWLGGATGVALRRLRDAGSDSITS